MKWLHRHFASLHVAGTWLFMLQGRGLRGTRDKDVLDHGHDSRPSTRNTRIFKKVSGVFWYVHRILKGVHHVMMRLPRDMGTDTDLSLVA